MSVLAALLLSGERVLFIFDHKTLISCFYNMLLEVAISAHAH